MATTITRYVNTASSGGDGTTNATSGGTAAYAGLRAGMTAEYSARPNLVTNDEILKFICEGASADNDTVGYTIPSFTTDATRYLWVFVDPANRHSGKYDTAKYRVGVSSLSSNALLVAPLDRATWEGVQFYNTYNTVSATTVYAAASGASWHHRFLSCVFYVSQTGTPSASAYVLTTGTAARSITMVNCAGWGKTESAVKFNYGAGTKILYNNTFYGPLNGINLESGTGSSYVKNNLIQRDAGGVACFTGPTSGLTSANNLTSDATSPDAAFRNLTATFVDIAGLNFALSTNDTSAKDAGVNLSGDSIFAFSTDIQNTTRSGTWDIGAYEVATGISRVDVSLSILA